MPVDAVHGVFVAELAVRDVEEVAVPVTWQRASQVASWVIDVARVAVRTAELDRDATVARGGEDEQQLLEVRR